MDYIQQIILQTPWWVYVVLVICIQRGIAALVESEVNLSRMVILPGVFLIMSLETLFKFTTISSTYAFIYLAALCAGSYIGYILTKRLKITPSSKPQHLVIQGSPQLLISVLFIFIIKYAEGVALAIHPISSATPINPICSLLFTLGTAATGLFIGRFLRYLKAFRQPQETSYGSHQ
jgi:teichoic acid transport system permease protein